jgi:hypothetical protein
MAFLEDLLSRELGGFQRPRRSQNGRIYHENCQKLSRRLLRHLILSNRRNFKSISKAPIVSNGQVLYDDGKLFLVHKATNSVDCHAIRDGGVFNNNNFNSSSSSSSSLSKALCHTFSLPLKPAWKDQVFAFHCFYPRARRAPQALMITLLLLFFHL